jgi:hypothetical protein
VTGKNAAINLDGSGEGSGGYSVPKTVEIDLRLGETCLVADAVTGKILHRTFKRRQYVKDVAAVAVLAPRRAYDQLEQRRVRQRFERQVAEYEAICEAEEALPKTVHTIIRRPASRGTSRPPARRSSPSKSSSGDSGDSDLAGGDPPRPSAALAAASKRARFLEVTAPPCARTVPSTPTAVALSPVAAVGCGGSR